MKEVWIGLVDFVDFLLSLVVFELYGQELEEFNNFEQFGSELGLGFEVEIPVGGDS